MAREYPVHVEVTSPAHFDRIQLLLRVVLVIVLAWVGITAGRLVFLLYLALPVIAAIVISSSSGERYTGEIGARIWRVIAWLLQFSAYMMLLVDRFPTGEDHPVRIRIDITGKPSVSSALARLATSIPSGIVLMLLWLVSGLLWLFQAAFVLFGLAPAPSILGYQRGVLRWEAKLVAYHASLVDHPPPYALDTELEAPSTSSTSSGPISASMQR
jgi:hypothetical protein